MAQPTTGATSMSAGPSKRPATSKARHPPQGGGFGEGAPQHRRPGTRRPSGDRIMNLLKHIGHALLRRRECRRVRAELETYSERELSADLRLNRSDIPALAAQAGR